MKHWVRRYVRTPAFLLSWAGAFFYFGSMRTTAFGPTVRLYTWGLLILIPFLLVAMLALFGLGWRRVLLGCLFWALAVLGAVEGYALAQEIAFRHEHRDHPASSEGVHERRWWPFRHHTIHYSPGRNEWWGDC